MGVGVDDPDRGVGGGTEAERQGDGGPEGKETPAREGG
jgi:hypothetical protein